MFNQKDQLKFEIISKLVAGLIDNNLAAKALNVSYRTILRYKKSFLKNGSSFLIHGNKGHPPHNATDPAVKETIMDLVTKKYYDFTIRHIWEKLEYHDLQVVSYKTLLRWCHEKKYIKRMKKRKKKIQRARTRMAKKGIMLQMDGSYHKWFGDKKSCLIAAIDDANSEVPYAQFFDSENTLDCMSVIQKIIEKEGVFDILYVDKAGVFGGNKRNNFCQLEEACKELGIQIIYAHTAEAKGRIERLWRTLQERLIPEMRLENILTKKQANKYLMEYFIPNEYNKKFTVQPISNESSYKTNFNKNLKEIFCQKEYRNINGDQTFSYNGNKYLILNYPGNLKNKMVQIKTYQDRSKKFFWAEKELQVKNLLPMKMVA